MNQDTLVKNPTTSPLPTLHTIYNHPQISFYISPENQYKLDGITNKGLKKWASKKGSQSVNNFQSHSRGMYGEIIAYYFLKHYGEAKGRDLSGVVLHGMLEREKNKRPTKKGDIEIKIVIEGLDRSFTYEVKTIAKGQQRGQILKDHAHKYNTNNINHIIFVEVEEKYKNVDINDPFDLVSDGVEGVVYAVATPKEVQQWQTKMNMIGEKLCYTHPDYV